MSQSTHRIRMIVASISALGAIRHQDSLSCGNDVWQTGDNVDHANRWGICQSAFSVVF
jgi:hypothetical protein